MAPIYKIEIVLIKNHDFLRSLFSENQHEHKQDLLQLVVNFARSFIFLFDQYNSVSR